MKENINTEAAILKAAETLFKEKGFKGTTTTLIAGQAGVTHAMLHYYFRTKEQIFTKVLDGYIKEMHDNFKQSMSIFLCIIILKIHDKYIGILCFVNLFCFTNTARASAIC